MEKVYYELVNIIKNRRLELGLTQNDMANRLGVIRSTYANWEQVTRRIDISSMLRICEVLDLDPVVVTKELKKYVHSK